jgi:hypothetical protein
MAKCHNKTEASKMTLGEPLCSDNDLWGSMAWNTMLSIALVLPDSSKNRLELEERASRSKLNYYEKRRKERRATRGSAADERRINAHEQTLICEVNERSEFYAKLIHFHFITIANLCLLESIIGPETCS